MGALAAGFGGLGRVADVPVFVGWQARSALSASRVAARVASEAPRAANDRLSAHNPLVSLVSGAAVS